MKKNTFSDLLTLSKEELKARIFENKKNIMSFRFAQKARMETKSHFVGQWKKEIARIKTLENKKELKK